jgi:AraC-like DNA-binding protein
MQGSISVQSIRSYLALASMRGLDVATTVAIAGVTELLGDIDARVPWPACERIAGEIVARIGIGGAVAAMGSLGESGVGVLSYVARNSATVGLAFRRVAQYYVVTSTVADCALIEDVSPPRLELRQRSYVTGTVRGLISSLWAVSNAVTLRQMLGRDVTPVLVELETARPEAREDVEIIEGALRCPVYFDAPTSVIALAPEVLDKPVQGADPVLEAAVVKYANELLGRLEPGEALSIRGRLRHHLVQTMHTGPVALRAAARELGTTARTLQRRLHEEGTSFHEVLDELRRDVAISQMRARRKSIDELAFVLGFEKTSSFHRAFKRWTGQTPGEFRKQG